MIKLNKVTLKQAEAAVRNIHRKTPVLSLFLIKSQASVLKKFQYLQKNTVGAVSF